MSTKKGIGQNILREMKEDFHEEIPVPKIKELLNEVKTKMSKEELDKILLSPDYAESLGIKVYVEVKDNDEKYAVLNNGKEEIRIKLNQNKDDGRRK